MSRFSSFAQGRCSALSRKAFPSPLPDGGCDRLLGRKPSLKSRLGNRKGEIQHEAGGHISNSVTFVRRIRRGSKTCADSQKHSAGAIANHSQPKGLVRDGEHRSRGSDSGASQLDRWQGKSLGRPVSESPDFLEPARAREIQRRNPCKV